MKHFVRLIHLTLDSLLDGGGQSNRKWINSGPNSTKVIQFSTTAVCVSASAEIIIGKKITNIREWYKFKYTDLIHETCDRKLKNNSFNGTLDMGENVSQQLQLVDLENNDISAITLGSRYSNTLE